MDLRGRAAQSLRDSETAWRVGEDDAVVEAVESKFHFQADRLFSDLGPALDAENDPITVGVASRTDDLGRDLVEVAAATSKGDVTFATYQWPEGAKMAEAHADQLVFLFRVLGLTAERGEVDEP
jgi:hypothetical protein